MGCDIHAHFEVKIADKWEHYTIPAIERNYALFEKMAGVRGEVVNAIVSPRGLPRDMSVVTAFDAERMGRDGHTHSWLYAYEIMILAEWGAKNLGPGRLGCWDMEFDWRCYFFGNSFAGFYQYPNGAPKGIQDLRLVFWFDN